jgi:hypothetical protein
MYRLNNNEIKDGIDLLLKDKPELLDACINAIYEDTEGLESMEEFHRKHMTPSLGILTVYEKEYAIKITKELFDRIADKVVIEIGAGIGLLSVCMATIAQRVYAIEVDPAWAWGFTKILYDLKQPNLTYIFGKAESMVGLLKADVVVILTRSGHEEMQEIAGKFGGLVIDFYEENPNMD